MPWRNHYDASSSTYGPRHLTREGAAWFWNAADMEVTLGTPDVVHSNNFWCPTGLGSSRLIYTLYDLGFIADPSWSTEANRVGCFEGVFRASIAADWIVAISDASRAHFLKTFPHFPPERICVIYPCSRFASPDDEQGACPPILRTVVPQRFWLSVGTIEPRKNQLMLATAYARYLERGGEPMPLVLAGGDGWRMEDFPMRLQELGISAQVIMTGYVSDAELVWLYRNCFANLYPSLFEGFGLPVLEGMQFGAPTIASRSTSIPEVAGDAAILLPPRDASAWADAMLGLAHQSGERSAMVARSRRQAARFDWTASARQLLALYEEAITKPKRVVL
jgi:glycosyltransferase involved in cell wall biosynthesis